MTYAWSGAADLKKHGVSFSSEKSEPNYALVCGMLATCRRLYFAIALAATLLMATLGTLCEIDGLRPFFFEHRRDNRLRDHWHSHCGMAAP